MNTPTDSPFRLLLARLSLPVRACMVHTAIECASHVVRALSFSEKETFGVRLAIEEAFLNGVDHYPDPPGEDETIELAFYVEGGSLVISVKDKGIPFDHEQAKRFSADDLTGVDGPGSEALLMHRFMDSVEVLTLGREGREIRLSKKIGSGSLPAELTEATPTPRKKKRTTVRDPLIRFARRADDMAEVCRLAWRCYGFTHEEMLYDPKLLTDKVLRGDFTSVIAIDRDSGAIIGHEGLKYHDPGTKVPELGLAFVDPAFRSPGLPEKMAQHLFDKAAQEGCKGIFDCSVTTHTFSQKGMHEMGARPCGLMLGIAASGMQAKELATSRQEKGSVVNHYFAFDRTPETIFIPERHEAMAREIYGWLDVPREFGPLRTAPASGVSSVRLNHLPDALNASIVSVDAIGADTVDEVAAMLNLCRKDRKDAVYAFIPTHDPASPGLVEQCERSGFSFAGVMPHVHDGADRILMQYVDIPLDLAAIKVFGDMTARLYDYVVGERDRVLVAR
ncbi:GNAT family N-acetyltransferase [Pseudodesulfovibrio portus]|nr:GNAT family N-acetyltransferase [Pseudodesulfovibrio portus]